MNGVNTYTPVHPGGVNMFTLKLVIYMKWLIYALWLRRFWEEIFLFTTRNAQHAAVADFYGPQSIGP